VIDQRPGSPAPGSTLSGPHAGAGSWPPANSNPPPIAEAHLKGELVLCHG
jgi:hypothetical protein